MTFNFVTWCLVSMLFYYQCLFRWDKKGDEWATNTLSTAIPAWRAISYRSDAPWCKQSYLNGADWFANVLRASMPIIKEFFICSVCSLQFGLVFLDKDGQFNSQRERSFVLKVSNKCHKHYSTISLAQYMYSFFSSFTNNSFRRWKIFLKTFFGKNILLSTTIMFLFQKNSYFGKTFAQNCVRGLVSRKPSCVGERGQINQHQQCGWRQLAAEQYAWCAERHSILRDEDGWALRPWTEHGENKR